MAVFVANTNVLELLGLKDAVTGLAINDATVTVTVCDNNSVETPGGIWPLTMANVAGSAGDYRVLLDATLGLKADTDHIATINVSSSGRAGHWEFKFKPTTRISS